MTLNSTNEIFVLKMERLLDWSPSGMKGDVRAKLVKLFLLRCLLTVDELTLSSPPDSFGGFFSPCCGLLLGNVAVMQSRGSSSRVLSSGLLTLSDVGLWSVHLCLSTVWL